MTIVAQAQLVAMLKGHGAMHAGTVDEGAVGALQILDVPLPLMEEEPGVVAGDGGILDDDVVAGRAPQSGDVLVQDKGVMRHWAVPYGDATP